MTYSVPIPEVTPETRRAMRTGDLLNRFLFGLVVVIFVGIVALLIFRFSDQAKQSTTKQAATRALLAAERQDCRSDYSAARQAVIEDAQAKGREAAEAGLGYLLSLNGTDRIVDAHDALVKADTRVDKLKSLPDMVDNGWKDASGAFHPPCPVVK